MAPVIGVRIKLARRSYSMKGAGGEICTGSSLVISLVICNLPANQGAYIMYPAKCLVVVEGG